MNELIEEENVYVVDEQAGQRYLYYHLYHRSIERMLFMGFLKFCK